MTHRLTVLLMTAWLAAMCLPPGRLPAADIVTLTPQTWDEFVPHGKEVDSIYGDYVMRNDRLVAVIANPIAGRNANMTVRDVRGAIIDLTGRHRQSDQLSAFYPGGVGHALSSPTASARFGGTSAASSTGAVNFHGDAVTFQCSAAASEGKPAVTVRYTLTDGAPYVLVESVLTNPHDKSLEVKLGDALRADRSFEFGVDQATKLFWAYDEWFAQAYGIVAQGLDVRRAGDDGRLVRLEYVAGDRSTATIEPGGSFTLTRKIFSGDHLLQVRGVANELAGTTGQQVTVHVSDPAGAVAGAKLSVAAGGAVYASGRTPEDGRVTFALPDGAHTLSVSALARRTKTLTIDTSRTKRYDVALELPGYVVARITDEQGGPIPCKVQFIGRQGTENPFFGPDSGRRTVHNLYYSHDGNFRQEIAPGRYEVLISYGPEYDIVVKQIEVARGRQTRVSAKLIRTVDTRGWISSDFHSHSSPSGDNTASQLGRVLNLLCEHIEFAPCTEHNRVSTYLPHLNRLSVRPLMATCTGMELTHRPGSVNHQNAFPLILKPRTQDGGAPLTDDNPVVQIERLALWDDESDKLVQTNHPSIPQIIGDRDLDGKYDGGYEKMFSFMDVVEVHPPHMILQPPSGDPSRPQQSNRMYNWMQTLNLGYRVPGVVNTDAHYNFHGSGFLRNYLKSATDDPAGVKTMDMVHAAERGNLIMTNGPFLEVELVAGGSGGESRVTAGDDVAVPDRKAKLHVRVQCPNWFDINRVQIFFNGRPIDQLNFTRQSAPERFSGGVIRFDQTIPLVLKNDTHVIVAAGGEGLKLGPAMGPSHGNDMPIAVSNPIFVDVDGDGFKPNGDLLGAPLPLEQDTRR